PPTYVYKLGAIQEFLPHCFKFGIKNAIRIYHHNTSKSWLEHLASDQYLSEQNYYDLYEKLLPGGQFHKTGWAMALVWTKYLNAVAFKSPIYDSFQSYLVLSYP
ncbi:hypothetical protein, partial [Staphylococcus aureus]|uniref:hypothetical protein n=1 Tax=Staphylococcus aureus TaxID=1280 RepID=UPI000A4E041F